MFNKESKGNVIKEAETVIGPTIKVKGNFHGEGNIIIDGIVEGSVKTNSFLLVGQSARIEANVRAKGAKIAGKITGDVLIEDYLEIASSANITGNIKAKEISIERGAVINGKCEINKEKKEVVSQK